VVPSLSPLDFSELYKKTAGNSTIKIGAGQKKWNSPETAYFVDIPSHFCQYVPESSDNSRHRGEPKPRTQRGGQRGNLAVSMRSPRILRVLAMTLPEAFQRLIAGFGHSVLFDGSFPGEGGRRA